MIDKLIDEIENNAENGNLLSALICTLVLPDICGKAEYPSKRTGLRYRKWYAKYIGHYERCPKNSDMPYASAEIIYDLRCHLLHQGEPRIDGKEQGLTHFKLVGKKRICVSRLSIVDSMGNRKLTIQVDDLIKKICEAAKCYYHDNKDKFAFLNDVEIDF